MKGLKNILLLFIILSSVNSFSQGSFILKNGVKDSKIKFKLINNLIVFPVSINGVELSFLLDTGVSKPILFSLTDVKDSLLLKNTEKFYLRGLGDGDYIEAYKSKNNIVKIGASTNVNQDLYVVVDQTLNFAPRLGVPIHGIIGTDIFKDFIVEVNYSKSFIKLFNRKYFRRTKLSKYSKTSLTFYNTKPYLQAQAIIGEKPNLVNLLIDTGGSDALWLFEDIEKGIYPKENYFDDYLGKGLSGNLYGKRSRIKGFKLGNYELSNVNVSFPDSASISTARNYKIRNGSVSGNILKRFNFFFDYQSKHLYFKKNSMFKAPFYYNNSGIIIEHEGVRVVKEENRGIIIKPFATNKSSPFDRKITTNNNYKYSLAPSFVIVSIVKNSPAEKVGLLVNDVIIKINGKYTHNLSIQDIMKYFYDKSGEKITLTILRNTSEMQFVFRLEDRLKSPDKSGH